MQLRDARNDVNVLGGWLPDMIRGDFGVKPATILGLVSDYDGAHSRNWDEVGCAADMIALVHGNPTSHPVEKILGFLDWTLSHRDYMRGEGSLLTKVYTRHIWIPKLIQWAACRVLADRGDARFAPYADRLYLWLRAGLGFGAICAVHVRMRGLRDAVTKSAPRPGVIVADGPVPTQYPALSSVPCGRRGWDGDFPAGRGWFWGNMLHVISYYIAEFALGKPARTEDAGLAIRQAWKIDTTLTTPPERDRIDRAIGGSVADLDWVVEELIGWYVSNDPVEVYRFEGGVISINLKSGGGPTNTLVAFAQLKSGVAMAMAPTSGHRGGSTDSHSAVVDLDARKVTATAGDGNVETMAMPPGALQWAYGWPGGAQPGARIFPEGGAAPQPKPIPGPTPTPAPPPTTPPSVEADGFDWLVNADANLAATGPNGFFGNICAVADHPHLFICRQAGGEVPWGALLLWRDEESEQIRLIAETGYRVETGEVGNVRTFWGADGRPGVVWLPRWIDRNAPMQYETRGALVDHALLEGHGPYRPDGSRLAPGEYQEDKLVARTELVHVGVTDQLGEPAAVVRRTDTMGAEPANVEEYEIGFGRGAYGFVRWQSWERREHKRHDWADKIVDAGVPCRVYGFDPLDPDCRERWFTSPGYLKPLPMSGVGVEPTRRPSAASFPSKPSGGGTRKSGGCLFLIGLLLAGAVLAAMW